MTIKYAKIVSMWPDWTTKEYPLGSLVKIDDFMYFSDLGTDRSYVDTGLIVGYQVKRYGNGTETKNYVVHEIWLMRHQVKRWTVSKLEILSLPEVTPRNT